MNKFIAPPVIFEFVLAQAKGYERLRLLLLNDFW